MSLRHGWKRAAAVIGVFVVVWAGLRYFVPFFLPFLFGLAAALAGEKPAIFLQKRLRLPPSAAVFAAVTGVWAAFLGALGLAGAVLLRRTARLAGYLTELAGQAAAGLGSLRDWSVSLAAKAPGSLAQPLTRSVRELFDSGGKLLDLGAEAAFDAAGGLAKHIPGMLVTFGTAVLSAYLICARLPLLRRRLEESPGWQNKWRPALTRLGRNGKRWFRAQLKLSGVTFCIVLAGYFLLNVPHKFALALLTAAVDAVPLLGTGTVLLPWALISFVSAEPVRAAGLLGIYVTALLTRSTLEPRLVGRQLGLDPLSALISLYIGCRLWGFWGMILAPVLTVTGLELCFRD